MIASNRTARTTVGFTLIELLVVVAIIGVLASVVLASLGDARESARAAVAQQQLTQLRTGIFQLVSDTGKGPNGCTFGAIANPEIQLNSRQAGLRERPAPGTVSTCTWTQAEVDRWNGPYFSETIDPWGRSYWLDPDYITYSNCSERPSEGIIYAIVSRGADNGWYTCDDVFLELD